MKVELKSIKVHKDMSEETDCFSAVLWIDGKKAAVVSNHGTGGPNMYHFDDRELERKFFEACKHKAPMQTDYGPLDMDADLLVGELLDEFQERKWLKKNTKTKIVFRLFTDDRNAWRTLSKKTLGLLGAVSPEQLKEVCDGIREKYGDDLETIANETA